MMTPEKERASGPNGGAKVQKIAKDIATRNGSVQAHKLPPGRFPGFSNLPSKAGVYRCKLHHQTEKSDPAHADFKGVLYLTGSKASVLVWVHTDGSLGLRLEKIENVRKNGEAA